jgi:ubiquinone/menaquinone biosynthesis C-methylase UbiE
MAEQLQSAARKNAQDLWSEFPCGAVDGKETADLEYFRRVEERRYAETDQWLTRILPYDGYRNKKVLEIGIGQGTDLTQFAKNGAICYGADITDEHLRLTAENFKAHGYTVGLCKCDAATLDFPDNSFDFVYSIGVIHHIPDADRVLKEIARVLKPGGRFLGAVYRKWSAFHLFQKLLFDGLLTGKLYRLGYAGLLATLERGADGVLVKPYIRLYTRKTFAQLCEAARLRVVACKVCHLQESHFGILAHLFRRNVSGLETRLGWYLVIEAEKQ